MSKERLTSIINSAKEEIEKNFIKLFTVFDKQTIMLLKTTFTKKPPEVEGGEETEVSEISYVINNVYLKKVSRGVHQPTSHIKTYKVNKMVDEYDVTPVFANLEYMSLKQGHVWLFFENNFSLMVNNMYLEDIVYLEELLLNKISEIAEFNGMKYNEITHDIYKNIEKMEKITEELEDEE